MDKQTNIRTDEIEFYSQNKIMAIYLNCCCVLKPGKMFVCIGYIVAHT